MTHIGRVADNGVKPSVGFGADEAPPDIGKADLPMKEPLLHLKRARFLDQSTRNDAAAIINTYGRKKACVLLPLQRQRILLNELRRRDTLVTHRYAGGGAESAFEYNLKGRCVLERLGIGARFGDLLLRFAHKLAEIGFLSRRSVENAHQTLRRQQRKQGLDRPYHVLDDSEFFLGPGDFRNVVVGALLDLRHDAGNLLDACDLANIEQAATLLQRFQGRAHERADDAIAAAQMVVQE